MRIRPRLAPSARLTAISLSRVAVRANTSAATLTHATTRSNARKNWDRYTARESGSKNDAVYGMTCGRRCSFVAG
ncbi:MAG: hypothetical protein ACREM1_05710 [Longimicrobiales bacterium]